MCVESCVVRCVESCVLRCVESCVVRCVESCVLRCVESCALSCVLRCVLRCVLPVTTVYHHSCHQPRTTDVSVTRGDSCTTDYAADNSSVEHSSLTTPLSLSPRRPPLLRSTTRPNKGMHPSPHCHQSPPLVTTDSHGKLITAAPYDCKVNFRINSQSGTLTPLLTL